MRSLHYSSDSKRHHWVTRAATGLTIKPIRKPPQPLNQDRVWCHVTVKVVDVPAVWQGSVNSLALVVLAAKHFRGVEGAVDRLPLLGCWAPQHTHNLTAVMRDPMLPFLLRYNVARRHDVLHQVCFALRLQACTTVWKLHVSHDRHCSWRCTVRYNVLGKVYRVLLNIADKLQPEGYHAREQRGQNWANPGQNWANPGHIWATGEGRMAGQQACFNFEGTTSLIACPCRFAQDIMHSMHFAILLQKRNQFKCCQAGVPQG